MFSATRWRRWLSVFVSVLLAVCVMAAPASATVLKLSSQTNQHGYVLEFRISPNGAYVVYRADRLNASEGEIFSVPINGGTPVRLDVPSEPQFGVGYYAISPDSQWVVYTDAPVSGLGLATSGKLFRVPIGGGASVELNGAMVSSGSVQTFAISPNSQRVVYRADQEVDSVYEVYSVPLDGSASPVKLNKSLPTDGDVSSIYRLTSDSSRVVYIADQDTNDVDELYSVPIAGPASSGIKINAPLVSGGDVGSQLLSAYFTLSPSGSHVVYCADQDIDGLVELYSARVNVAASSVKLNSPMTTGGYVSSNSVSISPDNTQVVFTGPWGGGTVSPGLYSVPIDGPASAGIRLNDSSVISPPSFRASIIADSSRVIFYAYPPTSNEFVVYSVPLAGPASAVITLTTSAETYGISPNGQHLIFHTGYVGGSLYSVPTNGPAEAAVRLSAFGSSGPQGYLISPDGTRLVYESSGAGGNSHELYSVPITGPYTDSVKISGPMVSGGNVEYYGGFGFSPDGKRVVYRADAESDRYIELYVTDEGNVLNNRVYLPLIGR